MWRSWLARRVWDAEVEGSSPFTPTTLNSISDCCIINVIMKYASIFFTILIIWIATILMALTRHDPNEIFELYLAVTISTLALFLIGFAKK